MMGPHESDVCQQSLETFKNTCQELGVPLAEEKVEGPATSLTFLGVVLDMRKMRYDCPRRSYFAFNMNFRDG